MGDGRQQPENGKGLGFEASARSERRFKTVRAGRTVEALHVSRRIELCCWRIHAASPSSLVRPVHQSVNVRWTLKVAGGLKRQGGLHRAA
jgi:hypothetical protein